MNLSNYRIRNLQDVVDWGLCVGCGACSYFCPNQGVELVNYDGIGIRPKFNENCTRCAESKVCLSLCPGINVISRTSKEASGTTPEEKVLGAFVQVYEGYSCNEKTRSRASSGGALSALAIYCLECRNMVSVLHVGVDKKRPWMNRTKISRNSNDIVRNAGSRYSASAPCGELGAISSGPGASLFIGKPCDAQAVSYLQQQNGRINKSIGAVFSFFCAGTPSVRGTLDILDSFGVSTEEVEQLRFRGFGWPGKFQVDLKKGGATRTLSYMESWGRLQSYRPFRCQICPDGFGENADISCGDGWHCFRDDTENLGVSVIIARTEKGRDIIEGAVSAGYIDVKEIPAIEVLHSQRLAEKRRELFGRIVGLKLCGVPTPYYAGFYLRDLWMSLTVKKKFRTIAATMKRVFTKRLWRRRILSRKEP